MTDLNWKTWALILVVLIGAAFELLKISPGQRAFNLDGDAFSFSRLIPYSIGRSTKVKANQAPLPRAHSQSTKVDLQKFIDANRETPKIDAKTFEHGAEKGGEGDPAKTVKKIELAEDEEVWTDPNTGKRYKRKKKVNPTPDSTQDQLVKDESPKSSDEDSHKSASGAIQQVLATGGFTPVQTPKKDNPTSAEDWERRLLSFPDLKLTKVFIQEYLANKVSPSAFYRIADLMLKDSRLDMKQLGVLCAGSTPSVSSFQLIAGLIKGERGGSELRNQAESFLNQYSSLSNLDYLEAVMRGTDAFSIQLATQKLNAAATEQLRAKSSANPATASTQSNSPAKTSVFGRFVNLLKSLTTSPDSNVNESAKETLSTIQSLIGGNSAGEVASDESLQAQIDSP